MTDAWCPYCDEPINELDICELAPQKKREMECPACLKLFFFSYELYPSYDAVKAPCLNGEGHEWEQIIGVPIEFFKDKFRCKFCDKEQKGVR